MHEVGLIFQLVIQHGAACMQFQYGSTVRHVTSCNGQIDTAVSEKPTFPNYMAEEVACSLCGSHSRFSCGGKGEMPAER